MVEMAPNLDPNAPIGVFDSGIGGLSVLRHVRALLPRENLLYLADSGYAPYGDRSSAWIRGRSIQLTDWLIARGAKAIVVACNTATAAAAPAIRNHLSVPVIAVEPAVKPATAVTRSGRIGVLATTGTLQSARFAGLLERFGGGIEVVMQPCPGLVEHIERGDLDTPSSYALVARLVAPLLAHGVDTIVLGCTHYAFVRDAIVAAAGPDVTLVDPGEAVARQVESRLTEAGLLTPSRRSGWDRLLTTGETVAVMQWLWPEAHRVETLQLPPLDEQARLARETQDP